MSDDEHGSASDRGDRLAPVIPLFAGAEQQWHRSWIDDRPEPVDRAEDPVVAQRASDPHARRQAGGGDHDPDPDEMRDAAERALLRRLRSASLSVHEARGLLARHGLDAGATEEVVGEFLRRGYLDDERLAEQLVHIATERKMQGRQSIAQTLISRGIPRDVVDATLAGLPDDDDVRALEFARRKAGAMSRLDRDTALRRLHGQLARRGFPGSVAMTAARTALDEVGGHGGGVRFR